MNDMKVWVATGHSESGDHYAVVLDQNLTVEQIRALIKKQFDEEYDWISWEFELQTIVSQ